MSKQLQGRLRLFGISAASIALMGFLCWRVPEIGIQNDLTEPYERAELIRANRSTLFEFIQTIGALGFVATAYLAWKISQAADRTSQITKDKLIADILNEAVEMLASEKLGVRLYGVHLLGRIVKDLGEDNLFAIEVLCTFIREKTATAQDSFICPDCPDIQAALTVIAYQLPENSTARLINLEQANLRKANLNKANLQKANLTKVDLISADLRYANLQAINLSCANLQGTDLRHANLQGTDLWKAKLQGAELGDANLQEADLEGANLQGANLRNTNLRSIRADDQTIWPSKLEVAKARNIPDWLARQLGIELEDC